MRSTAILFVLLLAACPDDGARVGDVTPDATVTDAVDGVAPDVAPDTEISAPDSGAELDTAAETEVATETDAADDVEPEIDQPATLAIARGDRCSALTPFEAPALPFSDAADTTTASDDYVFTTGDTCGGPAGQGLWGDASPDFVYTFVPPYSATYNIAVTPDAVYDPGLMVTDACPPIGEDGFAALDCPGATDDGTEGVTELVRVELRAGRTYYVLVDGWSNDLSIAGAFTLTIGIGEDCDDGKDDDGNGATDCADEQCTDDPRCDEAGYPDGCVGDRDDDEDGLTDCADSDCDLDRACDEALVGECDNGLDDEGDGLTDCADRQCADEPKCHEDSYLDGCVNGVDDEGDGEADCDDDDCGREAACLVFGESCETPRLLELGVPADGSTIDRTSDYATDAGSCILSSTSGETFGIAAPDAAYVFTAPETAKYVFETESGFDDALTVTSDCSFGGDLCFGVERESGPGGERLIVDLEAGEVVFVIVDGYSNTSVDNVGDFTLSVGLASAGNAELVCDDGLDGDRDGDIDCADADCAFDRDNCVETGNCDDGIDNDGDGDDDCDDLDCRPDVVACPPPAGDVCATPLLAGALGEALLFDTCELSSDFLIPDNDSCIGPTLDSPDAVVGFVAEAEGQYLVEVDSEEMTPIVDMVLGETCPAPNITACDGSTDEGTPLRLSFTRGAGQAAWFIVSAYGDEWFGEPGCGIASLTVFAVDPEVCDDATDNDRDGLADCDDEDCALAPPCNEAKSGAGACGDGLDNDHDAVTDCFDGDCTGTLECPNGIPGDTCASPLEATGATWTVTLDVCIYEPDFIVDELDGCAGSSTSTPPRDVVIAYTAETAGEYLVTFDLGVNGSSGYDALVNVVRGEACPVTPIASCAGGSDEGDPEVVRVSAAAGETLWVIGGGWGSGCGLTRVAISAIADEVCDDLFDNDGDGDLDCADADCEGSEACVEACDDAIDNDVDGDTDCADASCADAVTCNEQLNGPDACSDGEDDDRDGVTDCFDASCKDAAACPDGLVADTCASAPIVDDEWSATFDTCAHADDFAIEPLDEVCVGSGTAGDVIAQVVPSASAEYRVTLTSGIGGALTFDSVLNVVLADACPAAPSVCVASADDGISDPIETLSFEAEAGRSYWVLADGYSSGCGLATLTIDALESEVCDDRDDNDGDGTTDCEDAECLASEPVLCPAPAGEVCGAIALEIAALPFTDEARDTCDYERDYGVGSDSCVGYDGSEVVYRYTATEAVTLEVELQALEVDGVFTDMVLSASKRCPRGLEWRECADGGDDQIEDAEVVQIAVGAGETVYFAAAAYSDECAPFRLEVRELP